MQRKSGILMLMVVILLTANAVFAAPVAPGKSLAIESQDVLQSGDILSIVPAGCTLFASPNGTELIVTCLSSGPIPTPTCAGPCQIVTTPTNTPGPTHTPAHTAQPTPSRPRPLPAVTIEARYLPPVTGR